MRRFCPSRVVRKGHERSVIVEQNELARTTSIALGHRSAVGGTWKLTIDPITLRPDKDQLTEKTLRPTRQVESTQAILHNCDAPLLLSERHAQSLFQGFSDFLPIIKIDDQHFT